MMGPDIHRCKPSFKRRWLTKNRKRRTIIASLAVLLCLGTVAGSAIYLLAAGAKSAQAESAVVSIPRTRVAWAVPAQSTVITAPAETGVQTPVEPVAVNEPEMPAAHKVNAPKPALMPEPKTQIKASTAYGDMHLQTSLQLVSKHITIKKKPVQVEQKRSEPAKKAEPVKQDPPVTVVEKTQKPKEEPAQASSSTIPSFENTSGEVKDSKIEVASVKSEEAPVWRTLLSVIVKLAFVIALAYVSMLGLKWFMTNKERPSAKGAGLKVVESVSLGANRSLHVVDCAGKRLILASTPNQVNLISESEAVAVAEQPSGQSFDSYLQGYVASQSEVDNAAIKVGQALRSGASFLQKKAAEYRANKASGDSTKHA